MSEGPAEKKRLDRSSDQQGDKCERMRRWKKGERLERQQERKKGKKKVYVCVGGRG